MAILRACNCRKGTSALLSLITKPSLCFSPIATLLLFHSHSQPTNPNLTTQPSKKALPRNQPNLGPNDVQEALELLNRMAQVRPFPPISRINTLLGTIAKKGDYTTTLCHLEKLQFLGIRVASSNAVVRLVLGKWKEATRLVREMLNFGIYPNVRTFNVLVDALSKEGKAKEAEEVLEAMIGRGVDPNVVTYSSLMDGYCLQGQMDDAVRVLSVQYLGGEGRSAKYFLLWHFDPRILQEDENRRGYASL